MDGNARCGSQYVLGHSTQELERLGAQARLYDPFTLQFLRDAGIAPGMRVLDAGCGKGDVSFLAAGLVGHEGRIVGVDRVLDAVEAARRRAAELSLTNARFLAGDAGDLTIEGAFDAAIGRLVLEFSRDRWPCSAASPGASVRAG